MAFEFKIQRRVEFSETDMAGIVHYSNFFRYMEFAEHAFLRSLGLSVNLEAMNPPLGFPRVHAECDYKKPARFEEVIEIHLLVREKRSKVLSYEFRFHNLGKEGVLPGVAIARGVLTVVCVSRSERGELAAAAIPEVLAGRIEVAPTELLATRHF